MSFKSWCVGLGVWLTVLPAGEAAQSPYAVEVVGYVPGALGGSPYTDPSVALGSPTRLAGVGVFPGVVSPFSPAFLPSEIVSIGEGGQLTLRLDRAATESPEHRYGVDLLIFGNTGFVDEAFPAGTTGAPAGLFGADGGVVEVSADGISFVAVPGALADGLFPTLGYLDSGPYDATPGAVPTDFTRPVNPALQLADFSSLTYAQILSLYDGSGGGAPIDLAAANLNAASFVRISVPDDGSPTTSPPPVEIDAVAVVPEPAVGWLLIVGVLALKRRAR